MRSSLSTTFSKLAVPGSRPGWVEAGWGLCSSFWKKLSSWGDLPLVLFQKQNMFCRRQAPLIAGWESYGQLLPPLGSHMKRSHPGGAGGHGASAEHSARSGIVPLGSSRPRSLLPVGSASGSASALSWQAETPLSRTCRQNAPPVAGYHCPPRRSAGAAVRLHDSQRECPAGGGVGRGIQCCGASGVVIPAVPL